MGELKCDNIYAFEINFSINQMHCITIKEDFFVFKISIVKIINDILILIIAMNLVQFTYSVWNKEFLYYLL